MTHSGVSQEHTHGNPNDVYNNGAASLLKPQRKKTPLPVFQIFITFLITFAEPLTAVVIYPFAPHLVRSTGITGGDEKKTGYYVGLIESMFFITECLTVVGWARLSDVYGRRPVLLLGPLGLAVSMFGFGLSKAYWGLVLFRAFQGTFNGNIGVAKTALSEMTDSTNIADVFVYMPFMWSFGVILGPLMGGLLSNPATKWPSVFGRFVIFRDLPYFLPCAAAGVVAFVIYLIAFIAFKETHPDKKPHSHGCKSAFSTQELADSPVSYGAVESAVAVPTGPRAPTKIWSIQDLLQVQRLRDTLISYSLLTFLDMCQTALLPLFFSTSPKYGGLGLTPAQIGGILGFMGFCGGATNILFVRRLIDRWGSARCYNWSSLGLVFVFACYPILALLMRQGHELTLFVKGIVAIQLMMTLGGWMSYSTIQILLVQSSPHPTALATTNSVSQMVGTCFRALGPTFSTSLYSASLEQNLLGGSMVFYLLLVMSIFAFWKSFALLKYPGPPSEEEEEEHGRDV